MSTADERWCSLCRRWWLRLSGHGWTTDQHGAWVCPGCNPAVNRRQEPIS